MTGWEKRRMGRRRYIGRGEKEREIAADEGSEGREGALLAPSDVRLARVLVARDSSHLGKS